MRARLRKKQYNTKRNQHLLYFLLNEWKFAQFSGSYVMLCLVFAHFFLFLFLFFSYMMCLYHIIYTHT